MDHILDPISSSPQTEMVLAWLIIAVGSVVTFLLMLFIVERLMLGINRAITFIRKSNPK